MKVGAFAVVMTMLVGGLSAETVYYVDGTNGRDDYDGLAAVWDGTHGPKRVIQDAVDLFPLGGAGTIKVLPGVYGDDQGYAFATNKLASKPSYWGDGTVRCRVFVADKRLRIESTGGAERTHIVGKWSASANGLGPDAIRCIGVGCGPSVIGSVIRGFTLRDGATPDVDHVSAAAGSGAAVGSDRPGREVYVVDCVVSNCVARRGGAIVNATAVRSVFTRCDSLIGSVAYLCDLYASAAFNNGTRMNSQCEAFLNCPRLVHCAIFSNNGGDARVTDATCEIYNSVFPNVRLDYSTRLTGNATALVVSNCAFRVNGTNREAIGDRIVKGNVVNISSDPYVLASPWEFDFRPVTGSVVDGTGLVSVSAPEWVPEEFRGIGLDGRPLVVDGKAPIGPVATSVEMAGGFLEFRGAAGEPLATVDGSSAQIDPLAVSTVNNLYYIGSTTWPRQVRVRARSADSGATALYFAQTGVPDADHQPYQWCSRDNSVALTFPPADVAFVQTPVWATNVVYCAPNGLDTNDGLTDQTPKTINGACAAATGQTLVIALPGTYEGEPVTAREMPTRASVPVAGTLLRSRDGAAATVIKGVLAKDEQGNPTFGDSAVRCLSLEDATCAQGFTLTDGGVLRNENTNKGSGGGVLGKGVRSVLMDSVVTNCISARAVCRYAWSVRCRYVGNWAKEQAVIREAIASSCEFFANVIPNGNAITVAGSAYGCSFYETKYQNGSSYVLDGTQSSAYNCVVDGSLCCKAANETHEYVGCFSTRETPGVTATTVLFADAEKGDLRLRSDSPAVGGGSSAALIPSTYEGGSDAKADWARFTTDDIEGNLVRFRDGKPTAGARQRAVQAVEVRAAIDGEVVPTGTFLLEESDTLTVSVPTSPRHYLGYEVGGVFTPTAARQFTVSPREFPDGVLTVRAVFDANWYVNAAAGYSDENDGWTPETARQSLVAGVRDAVPGDVVHVAKGVYDKEKALYSGADHSVGKDPKIYSRVVVPAGVTLRGEDGPSDVIILGEKASLGCGDYNASYGTGCDAVRCVFLETGARIERVTCANGHSGSTGSSITGGGIGDEDNYGGGVLGCFTGNEVVSHCIITNCGGGRAGALARVRVVHSYVAGNVGAQGAAGRGADFLDCVIRDNSGPNPLIEVGFLADSTFIGTASSSPALGSIGLVANSVIDCKGTMTFGETTVVISNSVVCSDYEIDKATVIANGLVRIPSAEMKLDARGVPAKDSPLVDWTPGRVATPYDVYADARDAFEVPRVLNGGKQDLGGAEYDWRVDYGLDLCAGKISVTDVSSLAEELPDGCVLLPEGDLILDWAAEKSRAIVAEVTGNGVLALYRDGAAEPIHTWTKGSGTRYRMRDAEAVAANCRFVYTPGAADDGGAVLGPFGGTPGMMLIMR